MVRRNWPLIGLIILGLCVATPSVYSNDKGNFAQQKPASKKASRVKVDPEQESRVLELAAAHMPELSELLDRLRSDEPRGYAKAIRDLSRSSRKLQIAKDRDEQVFEFELELWKANNHVNLLVARLKVRDSPKDRKLLKNAALRQQQAQLTRIQYDIDILRRRIERATNQLASAEKRLSLRSQDRDAERDATYEKLLHKAGRSPDP